MNPFKKAYTKSDRIILWLSLFFAVVFLLHLYSSIHFFFRIVQEWHSVYLSDLLDLLWQFVATILFYKHKRTGWVLVCIYLSYGAASYAASAGLTFFMTLNNKILAEHFPNNIWMIYIWPILFYCMVLWLICNYKVPETCNVNKKLMRVSLLCGIGARAVYFVYTGV